MKQIQNKEPGEQRGEECHLLSDSSEDIHAEAPTEAPTEALTEAPTRINWVNMMLLFVAAVLYDSAVVGAVDLLGVFVMKEPLSWSATQVSVQLLWLRCLNDAVACGSLCPRLFSSTCRWVTERRRAARSSSPASSASWCFGAA